MLCFWSTRRRSSLLPPATACGRRWRGGGAPDEGKPRFGPLFDAHAAGRLRFAATTIPIAEVLTGSLLAVRLKDAALHASQLLRSILLGSLLCFLILGDRLYK